MTNFIIGAIFGIAALALWGYMIDRSESRRIKKEIGEDFVNVIMPKSKMDIKRNVTMYVDDSHVTVHKDKDKNIVGFSTGGPKMFENADFYYSLFNNKQIITLIHNEDREEHKYHVIITQICVLIGSLKIYYTVLNNYVED